jgi:hypothetical protein
MSGGKTPRLIVAHDGEEVLSTLNGDAQAFQSLKQAGAWDSIKSNMYTGGSVGRTLQSYDSNSDSAEATSSSGTFITNVFVTGATDEQSFRENRSRVALTTKRRFS